MLRHWFTMYLVTEAQLKRGEIMYWRGDTSQTSMDKYMHENHDMLEQFTKTTYIFQQQLLEDLYNE